MCNNYILALIIPSTIINLIKEKLKIVLHKCSFTVFSLCTVFFLLVEYSIV